MWIFEVKKFENSFVRGFWVEEWYIIDFNRLILEDRVWIDRGSGGSKGLVIWVVLVRNDCD